MSANMPPRRSPYPFTEEDIEYLQQKSSEHAISFLQDIRQYKEQKGLTDIPDVHFSRRFVDELTVLLEQDSTLLPPSPKRRFTDIFTFKRKRGELDAPCTSYSLSVSHWGVSILHCCRIQNEQLNWRILCTCTTHYGRLRKQKGRAFTWHLILFYAHMSTDSDGACPLFITGYLGPD